jgi:hypothetical protein
MFYSFGSGVTAIAEAFVTQNLPVFPMCAKEWWWVRVLPPPGTLI